jgi:hypothetical protein
MVVDHEKGSKLFDTHTRTCFDFWHSLDKLGILMIGWKLGSYWRSKGYRDDAKD